MKVYRRHNCTAKHRTPRVMVKCMFPRAVWVKGAGAYACLAWCRVLSVSLHEAAEDAYASKDFIDGYACGGNCTGRHEVVYIALDAAAKPHTPKTPTESTNGYMGWMPPGWADGASA